MVRAIELESSSHSSGSAIGIKTQFWVEDSTVIADLAIDRMNRIYVDKDLNADQISPELRAKIELERAQFQQEQQQRSSSVKGELVPSRSSDSGFHLYSFVAGLAVAVVITGWLRNQQNS